MTLDGFNEFEAHKHCYNYRQFRSLGFTQIIGVGHLKLPSWKLGVAFASMGLFLPCLSRYLLGFWFADNRKRVLYSE